MCMDEFQRWKLVGVFSFIAVGCNVPLRPPVFTRITSYLGWIQDKLGNNLTLVILVIVIELLFMINEDLVFALDFFLKRFENIRYFSATSDSTVELPVPCVSRNMRVRYYCASLARLFASSMVAYPIPHILFRPFFDESPFLLTLGS